MPAPPISSQTQSSKPNTFFVRVVGGILVIAFTAVFAYLGGWAFTLFVALVLAVAVYELWRLLCSANYHASLGATGLTAAAVFIGIRFPELPLLAPAITLVLLASLAWQLRRTQSRNIGDWAVSFAGGFYLGWTNGHLAELRQLTDGLWWLALTFATVWLADSGAYAAGRLFGRHKMAPAISPGKTWEGYVGGILASTVGGLVVGLLTPLELLSGLMAGVLVGALSVFGDLIESMIKRQAHAKDSGHLIPGHGGVFDRIDSLLWACVIVFYVASSFGARPV